MTYDYDEEDDMSEDGLLDVSEDEESEEEEVEDDVDPYEDLYGEDETDFPDEEEDEDNPDWYRLPEPGDRDPIEARVGDEAPADDDLPLGPGEGELFRHYISDEDESDDGIAPSLGSEDLTFPRTAGRGLDAHYDAVGYYGYVLIRRTAGEVTRADVKAVSEALKTVQVMVVRDGPSQRAAANGVQYGWYLRVQRQGGAKPPATVVEQALRRFVTPPEPRAAAASPDAVASRRIANLEARLAYQSNETASLRASNDTLRRELAQLRAMEQATRRRQLEAEDEHVARIQRVLSALGQFRNDADGERRRAELIATERDRVREEAAARLTAAAQEQGELARLADEEIVLRNQQIEQLADELRVAQNERDRLAFERDRAADELAAQSDALKATRDHTARRAGSMDMAKVLGALLPSVTLMPGSIDVMQMELADPSPVMRLLHQVVSSGHCHGQVLVRGAPGWCEVHFSTGQKDDGRLYYGRSKAGSWMALVSRKGEQDQDIARLRRTKL